MRLDESEQSGNMEDRRGDSGRAGGGLGLPIGGGGLGIGAMVVLGLIGWALGIDPRLLIGGAEILSGGQSQYQQPYPGSERGSPPRSEAARKGAPSDQMGRFVARV